MTPDASPQPGPGRLRVGSLCSGYGGIESGLALAGVDVDLRWIAEADPALDPVHAAHHPGVPNLRDIITADWSTVEPVDLVTAGFPCQPVSAAGRQHGQADDRWLWPHVARALFELRPRLFLLENVRNLVSIEKGRLWAGILDDLGELGFSVRWLTLGACHVGAAHHRHRVFALAAQTGQESDEVVRIPTTHCGARSLLPTPTTRDGDGRGTGDAAYWDERSTRRSNGMPLDSTVALLPTPRATVDPVGGPGQRGSSGDLAMSSAVQPEHWGRFAAAVARHAATFGDPPPPTEPNRNGAPRLAAGFAEWLMCLPAGHVTWHLPRNMALKAIGNGVCPQIAQAWSLLIDTSLGERIPSHAMTLTTTNTEIKEIQDREADARGRVIAAGFTPEGTEARAIDDKHMAEIVTATMMELAAVWREQAAWWENSGKRGGKGTAKELVQAAGRLAGFAVGLSTRPVNLPPEPKVADASEAAIATHLADLEAEREQALIASATTVASIIADLEADRIRTDATAILTDVTQEPEPVTQPTQSAVAALVDNPFTSPGSPGSGARPAVAALPYSVLPVIASQLEPRTQLSHSFVETFESCSLKSMLRRASRHGLIGPERPGWSLVGGTAFHAAVEAVERDALAHPGRVPVSSRRFPPQDVATWDNNVAIVDVDGVWTAALDAAVLARVEELAGSIYADTATWYASNGGKEGYDWWRVEGANMLARYLDFHDATWRAGRMLLRLQALAEVAPTPALELHYTTAVPATAGAGTSPLTTQGYIDAVWFDPTAGFLDIVDWKTGARKPSSTFQLGEYAHGLASLLTGHHAATATVRGSFWLARKGEYTPAVLLADKHPIDEITYRYRQAALGSGLGIATPSVSDMCVACGVKDYCPAGSSR